jgi:hypothetical protein
MVGWSEIADESSLPFGITANEENRRWLMR